MCRRAPFGAECSLQWSTTVFVHHGTSAPVAGAAASGSGCTTGVDGPIVMVAAPAGGPGGAGIGAGGGGVGSAGAGAVWGSGAGDGAGVFCAMAGIAIMAAAATSIIFMRLS